MVSRAPWRNGCVIPVMTGMRTALARPCGSSVRGVAPALACAPHEGRFTFEIHLYRTLCWLHLSPKLPGTAGRTPAKPFYHTQIGVLEAPGVEPVSSSGFRSSTITDD